MKVVLCPAASETGSVIPVRLNPEPLTVAADTVTLVPPVLLRSPDWVAVEPATALKLILTGFEESWPLVTPVPDSFTVNVFDVGPFFFTLKTE